MSLTVQFAERCAWRAFYVSRRTGDGYRLQFLHMGIDPVVGPGPAFFGSVSNPWNARGWSYSWRIGLPYVRWRYPAGRVRMLAYRVSARFWHSLDGRFQ
jgi:hypothetical protein